jgi:hypothetical protein
LLLSLGLVVMLIGIGSGYWQYTRKDIQ